VALFPLAGSQEDQVELEKKRAALRQRIKRQLAANKAGEADLALLMEADEGLGARSPKPDKAKMPKVAAVKAAPDQRSSSPAAKKGSAKRPTVAPAKRARQGSGSDDDDEEDGPSTWTSGVSFCSTLHTSPLFRYPTRRQHSECEQVRILCSEWAIKWRLLLSRRHGVDPSRVGRHLRV
jgi:hypothetical protein